MPATAPGVVGVLPPGGPVPPDARPLWPGSPLTDWGTWRAGEFRVVRHPAARLIVVGQCRVDDTRLATDFADAVRGNRVEAVVTRWPGSYLAVVVTADAVTAYVDPAGQYPLYWNHSAGRTAFGTSPLRTVEAAGVPAVVDPVGSAALLFCSALPVVAEGRTPLSGLFRAEAGEALRVTVDGRVTRWVHEPLDPRPGATFDDATESLREHLTAAVSARASGGRVSADLSGGLDSTSVALLAARSSPEPVDAFVYHHPDAPADDLRHARTAAGLAPGIRLTEVPGTADTLAYRRLRATTGLPDFAAPILERNLLRLRHVAAAGGGVHLGGEGADALLVAPPAYLGDLARLRGLPGLVPAARTAARLRTESPVRVTARAVRLSRQTMGSALHAFADEVERGSARQPGWVDAISWWPGPGPETEWLTASARRAVVDLVREHADRTGPALVADATARHELRASARVQQQFGDLARPHGVWPQAPFLDGDVVRACTSVPAHERVRGDAVKPLLRAALRGLVPDAVFDRRSKGDYLREEYLGARVNAAQLRTRIAGTPLADLGLVEPRAVLRSFDRILLGAAGPFPALNRLIAFDLWLRSIG